MPAISDLSMAPALKKSQAVLNMSNQVSNSFVRNAKKISTFTKASAPHHGQISKKRNVFSHSESIKKEAFAKFPTAEATLNGDATNATMDSTLPKVANAFKEPFPAALTTSTKKNAKFVKTHFTCSSKDFATPTAVLK